MGIVTQDPESTDSTPGGLALNSDIAVGVPFIIKVRTVTAAALKTPTTYTAQIFTDDAPFKMEVISVRTRLVSYTQADWTDADGGNLDVTIHSGTVAAYVDLLADVAWDDTYTDGMELAYPTSSAVITNTTVDEDESLRCQCIADPDDTVSAGAGADACTFDFYLTCIRLN